MTPEPALAPPRVILVDDDREVLDAIVQSFELEGFAVQPCTSAAAALAALDAPDQDAVVVTDVRMPGRDGLELLDALRRADPDLPVILVTGHGDIPMAVRAVRAGAWDFLQKPADPVRLIEVVRRALDYRRIVIENRALRAASAGIDATARRMVGRSRAIDRARRLLGKLAACDVDVLVHGETGTGKEVAARLLHDLGGRAGRFVAVNCGAIPETMIESELFGHEAGAFTGARERRVGKVEHASGGTLFLDEIESMPMAAQVRLLRVLQERSVERLGSNREIPLDLRVVAATKVDLVALAACGLFREDLVYRLNVATVHLPPLRERREDVPLLFAHFVGLAAARLGRSPPPLDPALLARLARGDWPGNVRELRNAAERHLLGLDDEEDAAPAAPADPALTLEAQLDATERAAIEAALQRSGGRIGVAATGLGITRKTLYLKMRKHGLTRGVAAEE
jgi:two-component system C4-dicarboxylate transport response regulator DctD